MRIISLLVGCSLFVACATPLIFPAEFMKGVEAVYSYPTFVECYKVAALDIHGKLAMTASRMPKEVT